MHLAHQLAHTSCQGRWVAVGGGGYDLYRDVPRAWSILWAEMSEQPVPEELPEEWVQRWYPAWLAVEEQEEAAQQALRKTASPVDFPTTFQDRPEDFPALPVPAFALELDAPEDLVLFVMGLSWHWDMEGLQLSIHRYRGLIK